MPSTVTRIHGDPGHPGVFLAPSASVPGMAHQVAYQCEGVAFCSCPSFQHRGTACKHVDAVAAFIRAEAQAIPQTTESVAEARQSQDALEALFSL